MQWQPLLYALLLNIGAIGATLLAWHGWRHRGVPGTPAFIALLLCAAIWMCTYAFEMTLPGLELKRWAATMQYLGIVGAPVAWVLFGLQYRGRHTRLWPWALLLTIIPAITWALVLTNDFHQLIWTSSTVTPPPLEVLQSTYGPWFWVHTLYSYTLMAVGSVLLLVVGWRSRQIYRIQAGVLLLSACGPWLANALYLFKVEPIYPLDLTPFAFMLSAVAIGITTLRLRLLDLVPLARSAIVDHMRDGVLVIDGRRRVVDLNPLAEQLLGVHAHEVMGRPVELVVERMPTLGDLLDDPDGSSSEVTVGSGDERRTFEVQVGRLPSAVLAGRLCFFRDISERKRAEERQTFLADASALLVSSIDYHTILETLAHFSVPRIADWCAIYVFDEERVAHQVGLASTDDATLARARHVATSFPIDSTFGQSLIARDGTTSRFAPMLTDADLQAVALHDEHLAMLRQLNLRSAISTTLSARGQILGILTVATAESGRTYDTTDVALIEELARRAALAVDNTHLYLKTQRRLAEFATAQRVARDINSSLQLDAIFQRMVSQISVEFGYQLVSIYLVEGDHLHLKAYVGYTDVMHVIRNDQGVSGRVLRTGQPAFVRNAARDTDFIEVFPSTQQAIIVPLKNSEGDVLGTLLVESTGTPELTDDDYGLLTTLADQVSIAVANARLFSELSSSEQRYRTLVEQAADSIFILDKHLTILDANERASTLLGYTREELLDMRLLDLVMPAEGSREDVRLTTLRANPHAFVVMRKDRSPCPIEASIGTFHERGHPVYVAILRDMTKQRQVEADFKTAKEAAEAATRAKSEFLATMSHEIRTPISSVIGLTSVLLHTSLDSEQRELMAIVHARSNALLRIINDILDFSKIESGKLELAAAPFNMRCCIEESFDMVALAAAEKSLDLAYSIVAGAPEVVIGDEARLQQILANLLGNAVKFTDAGQVTVAVSATPLCNNQYEFLFAVRDTGIGIPPQHLNRLFQSFSQVDMASNRRFGGTGLGLVISKRLTDLMGGDMWCSSEEGVGSTFCFTIVVDAALPLDYGLQVIQRDLAGRRLLLVDEQNSSRMALAVQAQVWGMDVRATDSAQTACTWLAAGESFDAAIVSLPCLLDGRRLEEALLTARGGAATPLAMLQLLGQADEEARQVRQRGYPFISKPIKAEVCYTILRSLILGLPLPEQGSTTPASAESPGADFATLRLLVADDDEVNQKYFQLLLRPLGCHTDMVETGAAALQAIEQQHYDVVLLDVQMPEMDGLEVAHAITRRWPPSERPYLIAVTANAMAGDREQCIAAGMDDYLSKPVSPEALLTAIARAQRTNGIAAASVGTKHASTDTSSSFNDNPPVSGVNMQEMDALRALMGPRANAAMHMLIATYLTDASQLMQTMRRSLDDGDLGTVERGAHRLKSSSYLVAATSLSELCHQLELAARAHDLPTSAATMTKAEQEYQRVATTLERERAYMA